MLSFMGANDLHPQAENLKLFYRITIIWSKIISIHSIITIQKPQYTMFNVKSTYVNQNNPSTPVKIPHIIIKWIMMISASLLFLKVSTIHQ
jgi:hypothetical protein